MQIFVLADSLHLVELRKGQGDTAEFNAFYRSITPHLEPLMQRAPASSHAAHAPVAARTLVGAHHAPAAARK